MSEAEKWSERVQEFKESGKSQRVWCAEKGYPSNVTHLPIVANP